jgi:hypothetical protein
MGGSRRPAINAQFTVCARTLHANASDQDEDAAVQVATSEPCTITCPANAKTIATWASAVELEILVALKVDPKRYSIFLHALAPADQPCPEAKEVRSLNYLDLGDSKPTVNGAYEVHFILKDKVPPPSVEELRSWQARWDVTAADPAPPPEKTTVTFCQLNKRPMRVDITSLLHPVPCDVYSAMRSRLGLMSEKDLFDANFEKVFGVDLGKDEVSFHFTSEECEAARPINELRTVPFQAGRAVRVHIRGEGENEQGEQGEEVSVVAQVAMKKKNKSKKVKKRSREA